MVDHLIVLDVIVIVFEMVKNVLIADIMKHEDMAKEKGHKIVVRD